MMTPPRDPGESEPDDLVAKRFAELEAIQAGSPGDPAAAADLASDQYERLQRALETANRLRNLWRREVPPIEGTRFGRFELIRELGRGGQGLVFLARDPELRREVALKIPRYEWLDSPGQRRRFLREARAGAALDHPGIVPVFDVGEVGAVCYIATAYVDAENLASWIERRGKPADPSFAANLAAAVADAVQHAHDRGIIHRDLKPANILLESTDEDPLNGEAGAEAPRSLRPRVIDFGLAEFTHPRGDSTTLLAPAGTPRYIAPELLQGDPGPPSPRVDVYSLGVILSELLGGISASGKFAVEVPPRFEAIVQKCLEREPSKRYGAMSELAADLRRYLAGRPVAAGRRKARRFAVLGPVGLAVAVVAMFAWGVGRTPRGSPSGVEKASQARSAIERDLRSKAADERYVSAIQAAVEHLREYRLDLARSALDNPSLISEDHDPRGFEWRYLRGLIHEPFRTIRLHGRDVYHVEFSPDGRLLLSAGLDGTARVWNITDGSEAGRLDPRGGEMNWAAFSRDGTTIATASDDRVIRLWNWPGGRLIRALKGHSGEVVSLAFVPGKPILISAGRDARLIVWDIESGAILHDGPTEAGENQSLALSEDGKTLLMVGHGAAVWEIRDAPGGVRPVLRHHLDAGGNERGRTFGAAISKDGRFGAIVQESGGATLFDLNNGAPLDQSRKTRLGLDAVALARGGRALVTGGGDGLASVRDVDDRSLQAILAGHVGKIWSAAWSPDETTLATGGQDSTIRLWKPAEHPITTHIAGPPGSPSELRFQSDGNRAVMITLSSNRIHASVIDVDTGTTRGERLLKTQDVTPGFGLSPDGKSLLYQEAPSRFGLLNLVEPFIDRSLSGLKETEFPGWLWLNGDQFLHPLLSGPTFALYDRHSGEKIAEGSLDPNGRISGVAPDGESFFIHRWWGGTDLRWERLAFSGSTLKKLSESRDPLLSPLTNVLAVSPNGKLMVSAGKGASIEVWDAASGARLGILSAPDLGDPILALAFSPEGRTLASGDAQGNVKLWSVSTLRDLMTLASKRYPVMSLCFSPDGQTLAAFGQSDTKDRSTEATFWRPPR